jgi:protein-disulfide isomerase
VSELTSAALPDPGHEDHGRGAGPEAILYMDLACPHCAAFWVEVRELPLRLWVRHFPIASRRPRAPALHAACEAAALQDEAAFWVMWDSLYLDRGRTDDPHLWERIESAGLDVDRFERDRRSDAVRERVERDFKAGIRCGVTGTPACFVDGTGIPGGPADLSAALRGLGAGK